MLSNMNRMIFYQIIWALLHSFTLQCTESSPHIDITWLVVPMLSLGKTLFMCLLVLNNKFCNLNRGLWDNLNWFRFPQQYRMYSLWLSHARWCGMQTTMVFNITRAITNLSMYCAIKVLFHVWFNFHISLSNSSSHKSSPRC